MPWVALLPRWASTSLTETGRAASLARPESATLKILRLDQIVPWPNGSYTVDPDCTGSLFNANGTKIENIIVLDGGKRFSVIRG